MGFWEALKEAFRDGYRSGRDGASPSSEQLATPFDRIRKHIPGEQITIGAILLIFGIFGSSQS